MNGMWRDQWHLPISEGEGVRGKKRDILESARGPVGMPIYVWQTCSFVEKFVLRWVSK